MANALILIDIQNDYFDGGAMALPEMEGASSQAARLLAWARADRRPVFHIRHVATSPRATFFLPDTGGAEIHRLVAPRPGETVIDKHRPNAFVGTDLESRLRTAAVTDLTICGAMSQMCVDATVRAAVDLGFRVTVAADACAANEVSFGGAAVPAAMVHAAIMAPLAASYARVLTTDEIIARAG